MPRKIRTTKRRLRELRKQQDQDELRRTRRQLQEIRETLPTMGDVEESVHAAEEAAARTIADRHSRKGIPPERLREGLVVEYLGRTVKVLSRGTHYSCYLRSTTRPPREDTTVVAVGDRVRFLPADENSGVIHEVLPRTTRFSRASRLHPEIEQVLVANVDLVVLVFSVAEPYPKFEFIDRALVSAEFQRIPVLLCLNKVDLVPPEALEEFRRPYAAAGYPLLEVSASRGDNLDRLAEALKDRISVFTGQSGVGKSSLLNALDPGFHLRTREVIAHSRKGRHTTSRAILLPLRDGGFLVDTPGIKLFELWKIPPRTLPELFPEFRSRAGNCRFRSCLHRDEPGCAVKDAVERGEIPAIRYENYLHILETLQ